MTVTFGQIRKSVFWEDHADRMPCICKPEENDFGCLLGDAEYYADRSAWDTSSRADFPQLFRSAERIFKRLTEQGVTPVYPD